MKYSCINGKGDRIEIDLAQILNIGKVFKDSDDFAFTATSESGKEEIKVGRFKTSKEAQKQRDALYQAKQTDANKPR
jgi:hypothetical protein